MIKAENYSLKEYNTFGFPAKANLFFEYDSVDQLKTFLRSAKGPFFHIGAGSNILFYKDFEGTVLHSAIGGIDVVKENSDYVLVRAGAGILMDDFVEYSVNHGYWGAENLSHIPGQVGASAVQNVGAYGVEAKDIIETVEAVDIRTLETRVFSNAECRFAYRFSAFKDEFKDRYAITHVTFRLGKKPNPILTNNALKQLFSDAKTLSLKEIRTAIVEIRDKKLPKVTELGSAGSFFKNPIVGKDVVDTLVKKYPSMPYFSAEKGFFKLSAGWLLETAGWRGYREGNVGVYDKHALILVHYGNGSGVEILSLVEKIQTSVMDKFGIGLEPEVIFV
ncbi:MAG: UDP-N-acetylmuramate dehydrogenase [Bacteroidaceae bacterium]|nr:UDP-N-acetylmuramate dehydrogenase [Bacteroidaceae bacterium]